MADKEKVVSDPIEIEGIRIGDDRFKIKSSANLDLNRIGNKGFGSIARGYNSAEASGLISFAMGDTVKATSTASTAFGLNSIASGVGAFAEGDSTAMGDFSHAEGENCNSNGIGSHAEGYYCIAAGDYSHAEGYSCTTAGGAVSKGYSHAEGYQSRADGDGSHVEGYQSKAYGHRSHVEGYKCISYSSDSHVEGEGSIVGFEKYKNKTSGPCHAEGKNSLAWNGSHAEGNGSKAYGYSHAEGEYCIAGKEPDGVYTDNHWYCAHAQGSGCVASGDYSFAGGKDCTATKENSIALGLGLLSHMRCQTVIGMYNDPDDPKGEAFCIGNGTVFGSGESSSGDRNNQNCFMVDWNGNVWVGGKITCGSKGTVAFSSDFDNYYKKEEIKSNLLPTVSQSDNGKILSVVDGAWTPVSIVNAEGVAY